MRPKDALAELEETVARMRALGVTEWNGIKLGALPPPPRRAPTQEEAEERALRREEKRRDRRFAASSIKPALPPKRKS